MIVHVPIDAHHALWQGSRVRPLQVDLALCLIAHICVGKSHLGHIIVQLGLAGYLTDCGIIDKVHLCQVVVGIDTVLEEQGGAGTVAWLRDHWC